MEGLLEVGGTLWATLLNVLPIAVILFGFQVLVLRRPLAGARRILIGFGYVTVGLAVFLVGLDQALFPLGKIMAKQLTAPEFVHGATATAAWTDYGWVYLFAAAIGLSTTLAEPALIADRKSVV